MIAIMNASQCGPWKRYIAYLAGLLTFCTAANAQHVELSNLMGEKQQGELLAMTPTSIEISMAGQKETHESKQLLSISFLDAQSTQASESERDELIEVRLQDGSLIYCREMTGSNNDWLLSDIGTIKTIALPNAAIVSARFKPLSTTAKAAWNDALQADRTFDSLAILRDDQLDLLNGAILNIDGDRIEFEFDGQTIPAPRSKVVGAVWFHRSQPLVHDAATVITLNGTRLLAKSIQMSKSEKSTTVKIRTAGDLNIDLDSSQIATIDYASANLLWLDQVEIVESGCIDMLSKWTNRADEKKYFLPQFRSSNRAGKLTPSKDLYFYVPGQIVLRVPEGYHRFETTVQRVKDSTLFSPIQIIIQVDGKSVWEKELAGDTMKLDIKTAVEPNKRLEIVLASKSPVPIGTQTTFVQPRLLR